MATTKTRKKPNVCGSIVLTEFELADVAIHDIVPNPVQPKQRAADKALDSLIQSITKTLFIAPPICARRADGKWVHLDGWRRIAAAKQLGCRTIRIVNIGNCESDVVKWFIALNAATKTIGGTGWLQIWKLAPNRKEAMKLFPYMTRARIQGLVDDMGSEQALARIVDKIKSPNLYDHVHKTISLLTEFNFKSKPSVVTEWMSNHPGMIYAIRAARLAVGVQRRNHAAKIAEAIRTNRTYDIQRRTLLDDLDAEVVVAAATAGDGGGTNPVSYAMAGRR